MAYQLADSLDSIIEVVVDYGVMFFEIAGVIVLLVAGVRGVYHYVTRNPRTRLLLAQGMAMALEFKLGSEILRTVTVRQLSECVLVAFIIVLRASLTFLLHWESSQLEKEEKEKDAEKAEKALAAEKEASA